MIRKNGNNSNIDDMLFLLVEDALNQEDVDYINNWLSSGPEAIKYYCDFINDYVAMKYQVNSIIETNEEPLTLSRTLDAELWEALAESEKMAARIIIEKPKEEPEKLPVRMVKIEKMPRRISKLSLYTVIGSIAAMLILGIFVYMNPKTSSPPLVAQLIRSVNAEWQHDGESVTLQSDDGLWAQSYTLQQGIAQIELNGGATVVLEAPVAFKLLSDNSLFLTRGKVVADVNQRAFGFTVDTPKAKYVDLGTKFGVEVKKEGDSEVHVFKGEVALRTDSSQSRISVFQGHAKQVTVAGATKDIPCQEAHFVNREECEARAKARQDSGYYRWLAYSYQLRRDPSLVAYYTFEKDGGNSDILKNTVDASIAGQSNGVLLSETNSELPTWVPGRWPEKTALKFDRSHQQMVEVSKDPALNITGPITLSAWINCPDFEEGGGGIILSNRTRDVIYFQMSYGVYDNGSGQRGSELLFARYGTYQAPKALSQEVSLPANTWHHLVVSHDSREVRYYLDGTLFDVKPYVFRYNGDPVDAKLCFGQANDGLQDSEVDVPRMFDGIMGEVAVFNRVLSGQQIREMYDNTKP